MNLLFDLSVPYLATKFPSAKTGVFRVIDEIAKRISSHNLSVQWSVFSTGPFLNEAKHSLSNAYRDYDLNDIIGRNRKSLDGILFNLISRVSRSRLAGIPGFKLLRCDTNNGTALRKRDLKGIDVFHSPFYPFPSFTNNGIRPVRVLTVYDLIPFAHPEWFESQGNVAKDAVNQLTPSDFVICISEATKKDLLKQRPDLSPERIAVTHLAASDQFHNRCNQTEHQRIRQKYGIQPDIPYFLSVCTLEPRKNLKHVIDAFLEWRKQHKFDCILVLAGSKGWKIEDLIQSVSGDLSKEVIVTGFVDDEDLAPLYSQAIGFLYLSLYEGFGLPPLEAMKCGTPVVTSNVSSLPEVVGDAAIKLSPTDSAGLVEAIDRLYTDGELRRTLSFQGLRQAQNFSWDKCVAETVEVYKKAYRTNNTRQR